MTGDRGLSKGLFIDGIIFSLQRHGGISVYFRELLQRLARDQVSVDLSLEAPLLQPDPVAPARLQALPRRGRPLERYRSCRLSSSAPSVFHSSYYRNPDRKVPTVVTVHDFIYERYMRGPARWVHSVQKRQAIRQADLIICISESTRSDLLQFVPQSSRQEVIVIPNGVSNHFFVQPPAEAAAPQPFVLFVGQRAGYKNFQLALRALAMLPELELLCVGAGPLQASELAGHDASVLRRVRHLGQVSDEELNALYNRAVCLVYPSEYEGFGIPILEAMRAGCPAVTLSCKAVLEVGGDALIVAESDDADLARRIRALLEPSTRKSVADKGLVVAARYSWERTYLETMAAYGRLGLTLPASLRRVPTDGDSR